MSNKTRKPLGMYFTGRVYVWDLDGTLACGKHRLNLLPKENLDDCRSWDEFNLACDGDAPIKDNIRVMNELYGADNCIIILTGRSEVAREKTVAWLNEHGAEYDHIIMRGENDNSRDTDYKERMLREIGLSKIVACWEDNINVARHIRKLGLTCYLVTEYEDVSRADLSSSGQEMANLVRVVCIRSHTNKFNPGCDYLYDEKEQSVTDNFGGKVNCLYLSKDSVLQSTPNKLAAFVFRAEDKLWQK